MCLPFTLLQLTQLHFRRPDRHKTSHTRHFQLQIKMQQFNGMLIYIINNTTQIFTDPNFICVDHLTTLFS